MCNLTRYAIILKNDYFGIKYMYNMFTTVETEREKCTQ